MTEASISVLSQSPSPEHPFGQIGFTFADGPDAVGPDVFTMPPQVAWEVVEALIAALIRLECEADERITRS